MTMTESFSRRSPLKRSACDRCRNMKLRCGGNESSAQSCTRCSQANAKCITSSAKLPGRPTRKKVQPLQTASSIDMRSHPAMFTRDQTMPPMVDMPFPSNENSVTVEDISNSWSLPASNKAGMSNHESHFMKNCFGDNSSLGSGLCHKPPQSIQQSAPSAGNLLHRGFEFGPESLMKDSIIEDSWSEHPARTEEDSTSETAYRICRLNMLLSRQSSLLSRRQQGINMVGVTRTEDNHDAAQLPFETGKVLQYMSDFLSIIQECGQARVTFGASENTEGQDYYHHDLISWALPSRCSNSYPDTSNLPSPSLNITVILTLLSCHLQLISIVDVLFQNLHATMSSIPGTSVASVQPIPGLRLAGLPIDHAGLQLKILTQVIKHQLEMIETALGLPNERRVTIVRLHSFSTTNNLLAGWEVDMLSKLIMSLGEQPRVMASLREKIERVKL